MNVNNRPYALAAFYFRQPVTINLGQILIVHVPLVITSVYVNVLLKINASEWVYTLFVHVLWSFSFNFDFDCGENNPLRFCFAFFRSICHIRHCSQFIYVMCPSQPFSVRSRWIIKFTHTQRCYLLYNLFIV